MSHRISRRSAVGAASAAGSLALLVACSGGVNSIGGGDSSESASASQREDYSGEIKFENFDTSSGNFEPATREHPARNVPKPKKPDNLNEKSVESFYQNIAFIGAGMQYLFMTADGSVLQESSVKGKDQISKLVEQMKSQGAPDKFWFADFTITTSLDTPQPKIEGDTYTWEGKMTLNMGDFVVQNGQATDIPEKSRRTELPYTFTGTYQDGKWEIEPRSHSSASSSAGSGSSAGTGSGGGLGF